MLEKGNMKEKKTHTAQNSRVNGTHTHTDKEIECARIKCNDGND